MIEILLKPIRIKILGKELFVPLFVILIVICLALITLFARNMLLRDKWRTLDVEWYGFSIDHPALLSESTYPSSGGRGGNHDYLRASMESPSLYVKIHQTNMDKPTLIDAVEWGQNIIHGWDATDISSPTNTHIGQGNYPAIVQTYYKRHWSETNKIKAFYVVTDNSAYMIEFFRVNEEREPTIQRMIDSFRLYDEGVD